MNKNLELSFFCIIFAFMNLSKDIIEDCKNIKELRALSFGLQVKSLWTNSTIFDYKDKKWKIFNLSKKVYYSYINILKQKGVAIELNGNIRIQSLGRGSRINKYLIRRSDINTVVNLLRGEIFLRDIYNQTFIVEKKREAAKAQNPSSLREYKRAISARKRLEKMGHETHLSDKGDKITYKIETISKKLNCSFFSVYKMLSLMVSLGCLNIKKNIEFIGRQGMLGGTLTIKEHNVFITKAGSIYLCNPNTYSVNKFLA